jgi:Rps23 Pro-64 3,4-dihydroxylase Tpa1-like proline 4-hydroxylase
MEFRYNPELDTAQLAAEFKEKHGRISIRDIWPDEIAEQLHNWLANKVSWSLTYNDGEKAVQLSENDLLGMTNRRQRELMDRINNQAQNQFTYCYHIYPIFETHLEGAEEGNLLHEMFDFLNSPASLEFIRSVTGVREIVKGTALATRYSAGHFLTYHDDVPNQEPRRVAYVINLTKGWNPNWGGHLNFFDRDGNITFGLLPTFNAINMFAVPRLHAVSMVAPFAGTSRYSIAGWFLDE